jgi:hypothetical protein
MNGVLTKSTRIYRTDTGLACNIPSEVLPTPIERRWVETTSVIPGRYQTIPGWIYVSVHRHPSTRLILSHIPSISPAQAIISKGLDPTKSVQIRPYRSSAWIPAHIYHYTRLIDEIGLYDPTGTSRSKPAYGRATLPRYYPEKLRPEWSERRKELWRSEKARWLDLYSHIQSQDIYPFQIRGVTLPRIVKRGHWKDIRGNVAVKYLDSIYATTEYKEDKYRWEIPDYLSCYHVLEEALKIGNPEVQCYLYGFIYINFMFPNFENQLFRRIGRCYRSTSHIKIGVVKEKKYEFKFDIRSHYLSIVPQTYYLDPNGKPLPIYQALAWTNLRLFQAHPGFANIRAGFQTGTGLVRRKWSKTRQRMVRDVIPTRTEPTLWIMGEISRINPKGKPMDYLGTENAQISLGEGEKHYGEFHSFYYCTKEVEYDKPPDPPETYDNARIEDTMIRMGARRIYMDDFGFVWLR